MFSSFVSLFPLYSRLACMIYVRIKCLYAPYMMIIPELFRQKKWLPFGLVSYSNCRLSRSPYHIKFVRVEWGIPVSFSFSFYLWTVFHIHSEWERFSAILLLLYCANLFSRLLNVPAHMKKGHLKFQFVIAGRIADWNVLFLS